MPPEQPCLPARTRAAQSAQDQHASHRRPASRPSWNHQRSKLWPVQTPTIAKTATTVPPQNTESATNKHQVGEVGRKERPTAPTGDGRLDLVEAPILPAFPPEALCFAPPRRLAPTSERPLTARVRRRRGENRRRRIQGRATNSLPAPHAQAGKETRPDPRTHTPRHRHNHATSTATPKHGNAGRPRLLLTPALAAGRNPNTRSRGSNRGHRARSARHSHPMDEQLHHARGRPSQAGSRPQPAPPQPSSPATGSDEAATAAPPPPSQHALPPGPRSRRRADRKSVV